MRHFFQFTIYFYIIFSHEGKNNKFIIKKQEKGLLYRYFLVFLHKK